MELTIMSGLPASGKSTYTNKFGPDTLVIHRDEWRASERERLGSTEYFPHGTSAREYTAWLNYLGATIRANRRMNICIDQTTLSNAAAAKLLDGLVLKCREIFTSKLHVKIVVIHTPVAVCKERNALRTGYDRVPDEVIDNMRKGFSISEAGLRLLLAQKPVLDKLNFNVHHLNDLLAETVV